MRKRSRYRSSGVNPVAHLVAMKGAVALTDYDVGLFIDPVRAAVQRVMTCNETLDDWRHLFRAVNLLEALFSRRIGCDHTKGRDWLEEVQQAVLAVLERRKASKTAAIHAEEARCLRSICGTFDSALRGVTCRELLDAERAADRKVAHASSRPDLETGVTMFAHGEARQTAGMPRS